MSDRIFSVIVVAWFLGIVILWVPLPYLYERFSEFVRAAWAQQIRFIQMKRLAAMEARVNEDSSVPSQG
jgi:hypothetical protein